MSDIAYWIRRGNFRRLGLVPLTIFEISGRQAALSDHYAVRNPQQLGIGEFDPGTRVAIVEQYIDTRSTELLVKRVSLLLNKRRFLVIDRHQYHLKRRDRRGPENAVGIVILFDGGGDHPRHADAVTAHEHGMGLALFIENAGMHCLAVQLPKLKDVTHLDAAGYFKGSAPRRAQVAGLGIADINRLRIRQVAPPIRAAVVHVLLVRA